MKDMQPVRIQRKRTKGFNLQEVSRSINGLPAISCTRPGKWGNPFKVGQTYHNSAWLVAMFFDEGYDKTKRFIKNGVMPATTDEAITLFRKHAEASIKYDPKWLEPLRNHNLACYCKISEPCHCDYLLELVNSL